MNGDGTSDWVLLERGNAQLRICGKDATNPGLSGRPLAGLKIPHNCRLIKVMGACQVREHCSGGSLNVMLADPIEDQGMFCQGPRFSTLLSHQSDMVLGQPLKHSFANCNKNRVSGDRCDCSVETEIGTHERREVVTGRLLNCDKFPQCRDLIGACMGSRNAGHADFKKKPGILKVIERLR